MHSKKIYGKHRQAHKLHFRFAVVTIRQRPEMNLIIDATSGAPQEQDFIRFKTMKSYGTQYDTDIEIKTESKSKIVPRIDI